MKDLLAKGREVPKGHGVGDREGRMDDGSAGEWSFHPGAGRCRRPGWARKKWAWLASIDWAQFLCSSGGKDGCGRAKADRRHSHPSQLLSPTSTTSTARLVSRTLVSSLLPRVTRLRSWLNSPRCVVRVFATLESATHTCNSLCRKCGFASQIPRGSTEETTS